KKDDGTMIKPADDKENYVLKIEPRRTPGVLRLYLTLSDQGFAAGKDAGVEMRAFAYNVDAAAESNLKRATKERLDPSPPGRPPAGSRHDGARHEPTNQPPG